MMHVTKKFQHLKIQLEAIKSATNNFADSNCIGKGGFGKVYKGELVHSNGKTTVAVKRLNREFGQGDPEFWKEVIMLSQYKHENIISLLGFCDESKEKILVYEYASKRSLDFYLNSSDLTWTQRLMICIGAARGLAYLHNSTAGGTQQRVLHRDIKSSNILLDENWNAKISDMGLSKFGPANQEITFLVSNTVGTIGYCDPVYAETGVLTKETDVYSFGVVLFEILCGRLSNVGKNDKHQRLPGLARQFYEQNKLDEIIHVSIKNEINYSSLKAFTKIAYQCLENDLEDRPLMTEVVRILERALEHQHANSPDSIYEIEYVAGGPRMQELPRMGVRKPAAGAGPSLLQGSVSDQIRDFTYQMLVENLFTQVVELVPFEAAPKITGMLVALGQSEAVRLLESPQDLKARVAEAMKLVEEMKQMLVEDLFSQVAELVPFEAAPKITGMLVALGQSEAVRLLDSPQDLKARVAEAMKLVEEMKQVLVEDLFSQVAELVPFEAAPKITGMLLALGQSKAVRLLESPQDLKARVAEAMKLVEEMKKVGGDKEKKH